MSILHPFKKKDTTPQGKATKNLDFTNPITQIFSPMGGGASQTQITDGEKLINAWLNKDLVHMKTNLSQNQINSICILQSLAVQFKIRPLKDLIENFITYMISKDQGSATQLVNILQSRGLLDNSSLETIQKFSK